MKLFTSEQIRLWDKESIDNVWGSSMALMDNASRVFFNWILDRTSSYPSSFVIFAGPGNNGGDAIAVAGMLAAADKEIWLIRVAKAKGKFSADNSHQFEKLQKADYDLKITELYEGDPFPTITSDHLIIDGIFGSGLKDPVHGWWSSLIGHINQSKCAVYSIDVPSGMPSEDVIKGECVKAKATLSLEVPKLSFFYPENDDYPGKWEYRSIGLSRDFASNTPSQFHYITEELVRPMIHCRSRFSHKGTYGHALLVCGSAGKMGAAILAARSALRSGLGLLSIHLPCKGENIMQTAVPEAMVSTDPHEYHWSTPVDTSGYDALGIGSGIGTPDVTKKAFVKQIHLSHQPMVLDADALNILSIENIDLDQIPKGSVLTPHPGEFKRLFGEFKDTPSRWKFMMEKSRANGITIVLKGAHTAISTPEGALFINSSGNPGMATAGSGDTLTGIITSLIAQGYSSPEAAILGVYWHGLAGDLAAKTLGYESLIASDIINNLGPAFKKLIKGRA